MKKIVLMGLTSLLMTGCFEMTWMSCKPDRDPECQLVMSVTQNPQNFDESQ
jgi:hypothetical protein